MGDLDRMEAAHERDERRAATQRAAGDCCVGSKSLLTGGERSAALTLVGGRPGPEAAASLRRRAAAIERRLCAGGAVTLRARGGGLGSGRPAAGGDRPRSGRGIPFRDPGVSRRHALLRATGTSSSSRTPARATGVRLGGARLNREPLPCAARASSRLGRDDGSGSSANGRGGVAKRQRASIASCVALAGTATLAIETLSPAARADIGDLGKRVRLHRRLEVAVRVDGHLIGPDCDLLHGDAIEVVGVGRAAGGRMNEPDDLADADGAERAGDPMGAALALRRHLERHSGDGGRASASRAC